MKEHAEQAVACRDVTAIFSRSIELHNRRLEEYRAARKQLASLRDSEVLTRAEQRCSQMQIEIRDNAIGLNRAILSASQREPALASLRAELPS